MAVPPPLAAISRVPFVATDAFTVRFTASVSAFPDLFVAVETTAPVVLVIGEVVVTDEVVFSVAFVRVDVTYPVELVADEVAFSTASPVVFATVDVVFSVVLVTASVVFVTVSVVFSVVFVTPDVASVDVGVGVGVASVVVVDADVSVGVSVAGRGDVPITVVFDPADSASVSVTGRLVSVLADGTAVPVAGVGTGLSWPAEAGALSVEVDAAATLPRRTADIRARTATATMPLTTRGTFMGRAPNYSGA